MIFLKCFEPWLVLACSNPPKDPVEKINNFKNPKLRLVLPLTFFVKKINHVELGSSQSQTGPFPQGFGLENQ